VEIPNALLFIAGFAYMTTAIRLCVHLVSNYSIRQSLILIKLLILFATLVLALNAKMNPVAETLN
jgi:hypothetical protein